MLIERSRTVLIYAYAFVLRSKEDAITIFLMPNFLTIADDIKLAPTPLSIRISTAMLSFKRIKPDTINPE